MILLGACTRDNPRAARNAFDAYVATITSETERTETLYGKTLFDDFAAYLGPKGSVAKVSGNSFSCNNCHLDSGTRRYGLSVVNSHASYPQYRARENAIVTLADRINSCIQFPMLGKKLDEDSREMKAMLLYMRAIGIGTSVLAATKDERLPSITYPKNAASPDHGRDLYAKHCVRCHGAGGEGKIAEGKVVYPPLWGKDSYATSSSMHRNIVFARFIKANMPFDLATAEKPVLTDAEAFDIAAFVNSEHINPRPSPNIATVFADPIYKPVDYPYGPFADRFPPDMHRYGPFEPMLEKQTRLFGSKIQVKDIDAP